MTEEIESTLPRNYVSIQNEYPSVYAALAELGSTVRNAGPLDTKTGHLVQLAGAAANRSEGSVHSHVRRAVEAGATPDEIRHAVILLVSTIGFPATAAALSWVNEELDNI